MTNDHEGYGRDARAGAIPPVPVPPAAAPWTAPEGSPVGGPAQPPQKPGRSTPKLVTGIILTVIGGLLLLGSLSSIGSGRATIPSDPAEAAGYLLGSLLFVIVPLAIGIPLIVTSKRKS